jgi:hypothetical protein
MTSPQSPDDEVGSRLNVAIIVAAVVFVALIGVLGFRVLGNDDDVATGPGATDGATVTTDPAASTEATTATTAAGATTTTPAEATTATTAVPSIVQADPAISDPNLAAVVATFTGYTNAINDADFATAYSFFGPGQQSRQSLDDFANGVATSQLTDFRINSLSTSGGTGTATTTFRSTQDAAHGVRGQTCSDWNIRYDLVQGTDGNWRIDRGHNQSPSPVAC